MSSITYYFTFVLARAWFQMPINSEYGYDALEHYVLNSATIEFIYKATTD